MKLNKIMISSEYKDLLDSIYYDLSGKQGSFSAVGPLYQAAKKRNKTITYDIVKKYLQTNTSYTLHKRVLRNFKRRSILSLYPNHCWAIDLIDYSKDSYKRKKYAVVVHDVFTHYSYAAPLYTKSPVEVLTHFKTILQSAHAQPKFLLADKGKCISLHISI